MFFLYIYILLYIYICIYTHMLYTHMHSLVLGPSPFWFKMNMLEAHTLLNLLLLLTCTCSRHPVNFSFSKLVLSSVSFLFWWMICTYGSLRYYLYYIILYILYIFEEWNKIDFKACRESFCDFFLRPLIKKQFPFRHVTSRFANLVCVHCFLLTLQLP